MLTSSCLTGCFVSLFYDALMSTMLGSYSLQVTSNESYSNKDVTFCSNKVEGMSEKSSLF